MITTEARGHKQLLGAVPFVRYRSERSDLPFNCRGRHSATEHSTRCSTGLNSLRGLQAVPCVRERTLSLTPRACHSRSQAARKSLKRKSSAQFGDQLIASISFVDAPATQMPNRIATMSIRGNISQRAPKISAPYHFKPRIHFRICYAP